MDRPYRIYKINFPDGRSYIGCTITPVETRIAGHVAEAHGPYIIHKNTNGIAHAIRRFGPEVMSYQQIASATEAQAAAETETLLIAQHGTMFPNGYNLRARSGISRGVKQGIGRALKPLPRDIYRAPRGACAVWPPKVAA